MGKKVGKKRTFGKDKAKPQHNQPSFPSGHAHKTADKSNPSVAFSKYSYVLSDTKKIGKMVLVILALYALLFIGNSFWHFM